MQDAKASNRRAGKATWDTAKSAAAAKQADRRGAQMKSIVSAKGSKEMHKAKLKNVAQKQTQNRAKVLNAKRNIKNSNANATKNNNNKNSNNNNTNKNKN